MFWRRWEKLKTNGSLVRGRPPQQLTEGPLCPVASGQAAKGHVQDFITKVEGPGEGGSLDLGKPAG